MSLVKNLPTRWQKTKEENRIRITWWLLREKYWWKVVDEKPPDSREVLERKLTSYDWGLKGRGRRFRHETWKSKGRCLDEGWLEVMCSHAQCGCRCWVWSYPNLSNNTIKIKRSLVLFGSFVSAIGWSSSLFFRRLSGLDYRSSHW